MPNFLPLCIKGYSLWKNSFHEIITLSVSTFSHDIIMAVGPAISWTFVIQLQVKQSRFWYYNHLMVSRSMVVSWSMVICVGIASKNKIAAVCRTHSPFGWLLIYWWLCLSVQSDIFSAFLWLRIASFIASPCQFIHSCMLQVNWMCLCYMYI